MTKTLSNTTPEEAKANVSDLQTKGDPDTFKVVCKAWSVKEEWMKSTKAMEIPGYGCLIQVSTQQMITVPNQSGSQLALAEALVFVPGTKLEKNEDGTFRVVKSS